MKDNSNTPPDDPEKYLLNVRRDHVDLYNNIIENFKQYHFILNSGAMSALSIYALSKEPATALLQYAGIIFFIGTLFSIYGIILDFYYSYSKLAFFDKFFFRNLPNDPINLQVKKQKHVKYEYNMFKYDDRSIHIRQINGVLAYLCFVLGVSIIIFSNANKSVFSYLIISIVLFIIYFVISFGYMLYNCWIAPTKNITTNAK